MNLFELICIIVGLIAVGGAGFAFAIELFLEKYDTSRKVAVFSFCVAVLAGVAFMVETIIRVYMGSL